MKGKAEGGSKRLSGGGDIWAVQAKTGAPRRSLMSKEPLPGYVKVQCILGVNASLWWEFRSLSRDRERGNQTPSFMAHVDSLNFLS